MLDLDRQESAGCSERFKALHFLPCLYWKRSFQKALLPTEMTLHPLPVGLVMLAAPSHPRPPLEKLSLHPNQLFDGGENAQDARLPGIHPLSSLHQTLHTMAVYLFILTSFHGLPTCTRVKNPLANEGDIRDEGSIPWLRRSPGGGHGNPLQYSCLESPTDRGAWRAIAHTLGKSWTQLQ